MSAYRELADVELDCLDEDEAGWDESWGPKPTTEELRPWNPEAPSLPWKGEELPFDDELPF